MLTPLLILMLAFRPVSSHTVTGKVTDETGNALAGVSITIKGTGTKTISAADGTFQLNVPQAKSTLVFSAVGYKLAEVPVKDQAIINVVLVRAKAKLEEVVVTDKLGKRGARHEEVYYKSVATLGMAGSVPGVRVRGYYSLVWMEYTMILILKVTIILVKIVFSK